MGKYSKLRAKILAGTSDTSIDFAALRQLLRRLGFRERAKGSHHIFTRDDVAEIINIQPVGAHSMSIKYELIIYWSEQDGAFIVEVPELPGCMADDRTYEEAIANAQQVIADWIEMATELGRPIPQPNGRLVYA